MSAGTNDHTKSDFPLLRPPIMPGSAAVDWNTVVFSALTHQGHLRPRNVGNLLQDDGVANNVPLITVSFLKMLSIPPVPGKLKITRSAVNPPDKTI